MTFPLPDPEPTNIDPDRLPHEIRRAFDREMVLIDTVDPGLYVEPEPDHDRLAVLDRHGVVLCHVPLGRLREIDTDRLEPFADAALAALPVDVRDQLVTAANAGEAVVHDDPTSEWVTVDVLDHKLMAVHRAHLVAGWPDDTPPAA